MAIGEFDLKLFPIILTFEQGTLSNKDFSIEFHLFPINELKNLGNKIIDDDNALANNQKIIQLALHEYGVLKTGTNDKLYSCDSGDTQCSYEDVVEGIKVDTIDMETHWAKNKRNEDKK